MVDVSLIKFPVYTEKTASVACFGNDDGSCVFCVRKGSTKPQIKDALEALFGVKVRSVNTLNVSGKERRYRGVVGRRAGFKKVYVRFVGGFDAGVMVDVQSESGR